ncbi:Crp/Fnr family transcriptional regulator [Chryseobacterium sp. SSA4.19]|uniref:Crp/Fnr family transcriptional regulator n=1 Tax=Chryseobacterium sp. SSA4.19 TaxID=2919915 RepID=UPI001F4EB0A7|nr:Crp/Fnr family transcriptional regulator [Chryseobacterium sp. SSA4.19]MCJ8153007.1 Crp/Fnr family transcriptional regulator [Chryseobacterium sp. SSA4.19]
METQENHEINGFIDFASSLTPLEKEAEEALACVLRQKSYEKGNYLLEEGTVCSRIYFIDSGLVKTFFYTDTREFIMRFFPEGSMFTELGSFVTRRPSDYSIEALEPTEITYLDHADLEKLCSKYHSMETYFRKLVSLAAVNMMDRIGGTLEEKAQVAYRKFLKEQGKLLQRISLADLASYLGITQVSLSRIRGMK